MDKKQWQKLEDIFFKIAELPDEKQQSYICEHTEENSELRRQLEYMFLSNDSNSLETIIGSSANDLIQSEIPIWINDIGQYKVLKLIAHGGMSSVYLAKRIDCDFEQLVAIKVHNTPLIDPNSKARFLRERQILADFSHPNIAKLIDGGTSEEGTPYLVMEYISGLPIDQYCDSNKLNLKQRINLLKKICSAVNYAHQHLIIHRDIKPSNILVDQRGEPYLLDFGIAKMVDDHRLANSLQTQTKHLILTPEIASPEQIRGETISQATDVYGLGVLLYKLVTGSYPFQNKNVKKNSKDAVENSPYLQFETLVCTTPPTKPSTQLRDNSITQTQPSYGQSINTVFKEIQGDLENIILKALRKHPGNRYSNGELLAEDLQRYLDNQPVLAKPQTTLYRLKKTIQRHRVASFTSLAGLLLLTITVTIYTVKLKAQKELAEQRLLTSNAVTQLLVDSFEVSDPNESLGNKITARQILDQGARQIENQSNMQPAVKARLHSVIGQVYLSLGIFSKAEQLLKAAYLESNSVSGAASENSIQIQFNLGKLQSLTGRFKLAEETLQSALKKSTLLSAEINLLSGEIINELVNNAIEFENIQLAETLLNENLEKFTMALPKTHPLPFKLLNLKISLQLRLGQVAKAIDLASKSYAKSVKYLGKQHRQTLDIHKLLGHAYFDNHQYQKALASYLLDFKIDQKIYGEDHYTSIGHLIDLGSVYRSINNFEKSVFYNLKVIELSSRLLGENHADVADGYNSLGLTYRQQGKYPEAIKALKRSLKINQTNFGVESKEAAINHNNLGATYNFLGDYKQAEKHLMKGLFILEKRLGRYSEKTAFSYNHIGAFYYSQKNYKEALNYFNAVIEIRDKILSENSPIKIHDKAIVAMTNIRMKDFAAAKVVLDDVILGESNFYQQSSVAHYYVRLVETALLASLKQCVQAEKKYQQLLTDASNKMSDLPGFLTRPNDLLEQCNR